MVTISGDDAALVRARRDITPAERAAQAIDLAKAHTARFCVTRQSGETQTQEAMVVRDGSLFIAELPDTLLIVPAEGLSSDDAIARFRSGLIKYAGRKPNIVIELNRQGPLGFDSIVAPLIELRRASGRSKIFVATEDISLHELFARTTKGRVWTTVNTGREALHRIEDAMIEARRGKERERNNGTTSESDGTDGHLLT